MFPSVRADVDVPMICVLGDQSVGKSSVIEAISGIKLLRALDTYTRYIPLLRPPHIHVVAIFVGLPCTVDCRDIKGRGGVPFP